MGKTEISVLLLFLSCSLGAVVDIFGHVRSFADRKKQPVIQSVGRVDALCVPLRRKRDKWLDNCETCRLLNVSARTMQTYRDTGKLPYSQINNKIYYKASDVETFLLNQVRDNSKK